jgi:hypothetical protein
MLRHSRRQVSYATIAGASLLTLALGVGAFPRIAAAWPVGQDGTVTLDDFTVTATNGNIVTIKHAEFEGTNLTEEEIKKLLTPDTPADEEAALAQKLKAGSISIPLVDVAVKKGGAVHIHDVTASDIDSGKIGKFGFASVDGSGTDEDGPVSIKSGAFKMENADLADALGSLGNPSQISPTNHLGYVSWQGVDFVVPDKEAGAGKTTHIALTSFELRNNYDGAILKDAAMKLKGLIIEPSKGSEFANNLAMMNYTRLELNSTIAAHYDAASKKFTLDDFTLDDAGAGAIGLKASFENIDPALFGADSAARMGAVADGAISSLEIKVVNAGLFEKSIAFFADQQKTTAAALKKQWTDAAGQMLPAVLGGDPSALKIAAEAQKFIGAPTNLTIAVHPKSGALKFSDAMAGGDPMALVSTLDISASANK